MQSEAYERECRMFSKRLQESMRTHAMLRGIHMIDDRHMEVLGIAIYEALHLLEQQRMYEKGLGR